MQISSYDALEMMERHSYVPICSQRVEPLSGLLYSMLEFKIKIISVDIGVPQYISVNPSMVRFPLQDSQRLTWLTAVAISIIKILYLRPWFSNCYPQLISL